MSDSLENLFFPSIQVVVQTYHSPADIRTLLMAGIETTKAYSGSNKPFTGEFHGLGFQFKSRTNHVPDVITWGSISPETNTLEVRTECIRPGLHRMLFLLFGGGAGGFVVKYAQDGTFSPALAGFLFA